MRLRFASFEVGADGIGALTLDYPDSKVNKLSDAVWLEFDALAGAWKDDPLLKGVVISSAKRGIFMAGADIEELQHISAPATALEMCSRAQLILHRLETCGKPVVCAVAGAALGGGMELVLATHGLVVASDGKVKLGLPETKLGLIPGAGGTQRLPRRIGVEKAADLVVSGDWFGPEEAVRLGLAAKAVPSDRLLDEARALTKSLAGNHFKPWGSSAAADPEQIFLRKFSALNRSDARFDAWVAGLVAVIFGAGKSMSEGLRLEREAFAGLAAGVPAKDLIRRFLDGERL